MSDDMVDIDLGSNGEVLPAKNNKIALIDADTIVFAACSVCEYFEDILPRHMYTDEEWSDILASDGYCEDEGVVYGINLGEAMQHSKDKINIILEQTGCSDYELHFTSGRSSFRYKTLDTYKSNRTGRTITGITDLKHMFVHEDSAKSFIWYEWEADDMVVSLKRDNPDKYVLCSVDKDVLYTLAGSHFNYYISTKHHIPMKWVDVSYDRALKHHYIQTLTGDNTDGIIGLHGIGPKKAEKLLKGLTTKEELWDAVVKAYTNNKRDEVDAILNMRLVNMHQLKLVNDKYEVELWRS